MQCLRDRYQVDRRVVQAGFLGRGLAKLELAVRYGRGNLGRARIGSDDAIEVGSQPAGSLAIACRAIPCQRMTDGRIGQETEKPFGVRRPVGRVVARVAGKMIFEFRQETY